ncbi:MAG: hypothetical protein SGJ21_09635 [Alphaproteobacteria bacterium]|nr:hypothetical protein [Alphaproteobacteria bacterium]
MARDPLRRVIRQTFFLTGLMFGRWGVWLTGHGRAARLSCSEKIASHRADELADRMIVLEDRIGKRADKLPAEVGTLASRISATTHALETSAAALSSINLNEAAERAVRSALPRVEEGRGVTKVNRAIGATRQAMADQIKLIRPELGVVATEAPRLRVTAEKLAGVEQRFTQGVDLVNRSFTAYEECLRSPDRIAVAGKHSIVIPWLIALLIMSIALSGVFLNFFLIERPMAEIVGESARIGGVGLPAFAAMIVIFLEFVAGVILMDAAGFTRLIPAFHAMSDAGRRVMFWVAFAFLAAFSFLEASLAIVREEIIESQQATEILAGSYFTAPAAAPEATSGAQADGEPVAPAEPIAPAARERASVFGLSLTTTAQIILAVLIPWMLATAALPLETIVRNSVFMLQIAGGFLLLAAGFVCKTIAAALRSVGYFALSVYDLIIFVPLFIEKRFFNGAREEDSGPFRKRKPSPPVAETGAGPELERKLQQAS